MDNLREMQTKGSVSGHRLNWSMTGIWLFLLAVDIIVVLAFIKAAQYAAERWGK